MKTFLILMLSAATVFGAPLFAGGKQSAAQPKAGDDVSARIASLASALFQPDSPGGVILAAKGGDIVYHEAFGKANLELGVNSDTNTVYRIASNTKPFTAVAILKLAEEGRLSLTDPLTKYIPDYPVVGQNVARIEHLLSHTSGIANYSGLDNFNKELQYSHAEFIALFKNEDMAFSPGSDFRYSNSGYYLLGYIIEQVTGMAYAEYLQTAFFDPLGMTRTRVDDVNEIIPGRADGYYQGDTGFSKAHYMSNTFSQTPAGGIRSTAHDMFKWYTALGNGDLIGEKSLKKATQLFELTNGDRGRTGFAWFVGSMGPSRFLTHDGSDLGFYSSLVYLPDEQIFAVILTNCNWNNGGDYINAPLRIASMLTGSDYYRDSPSRGSDIDAIQGLYKSKNGETLVLFSSNGNAFLQDDSGRQSRLFELSEHVYFSERIYATIEWVPGSRWDNSTIVVRTDNETTYSWAARVETG